MHEILANLSILFRLLAKCAVMTGVGPAALLVCVFEWWMRRAPKAKPELVKFPRWGERTAPLLRSQVMMVGAGARPVSLRRRHG
jgi:hypothetical protein